MVMKKSLFDMISSDLPPKFVSQVIDAAIWAYRDAYEAIISDNTIGDHQKGYLLPHMRRAKIETKVMEIALDCALNATVEKNVSNNTNYTLIRCGRFVLTISMTGRRNNFPANKCNFRKQYSEINQHIQQLQLFEIDSEPECESIYGIIIHGHNFSKQGELGFINIGFPDPTKLDKWVDIPLDLMDVKELQNKFEDTSGESGSIIQPKLKKCYLPFNQKKEVV